MRRTMFRDEVEAWRRQMHEAEQRAREHPCRGTRMTPAEAEALRVRLVEENRRDRARADWYLEHDSCDGPWPGETDPSY